VNGSSSTVTCPASNILAGYVAFSVYKNLISNSCSSGRPCSRQQRRRGSMHVQHVC
jgi:hypothetical protein